MAPLRTEAQKRLIKAIQACRRQVQGLGEEEPWRGFLALLPGGRTSLRTMNGVELGRVLDALHKAGAPSRPGGPAKSRYTDDQQLRMMRGLWIELHEAGKVADPSEDALGAFIKRQTKQDMGALDAASSRSVIQALKAMLNRPAPTRRRAA